MHHEHNTAGFDRRFLLGGLAGAAGVSALAAITRAGPLDPPAGVVASTSKPLGEIEPRIAVNATNTPGNATANFIISAPGSYYLTGDVNGVSGKIGIRITSGYVTLDLNGFNVRGTAGALEGIDVAGTSQITIRNGEVSEWPKGGIITGSSFSGHMRVSRVLAAGNGLGGIRATGFNVLVEDCLAYGNCNNTSSGGFANLNGAIEVGSESIVARCVASNNATSNTASIRFAGIAAGDGCRILDCVARFNAQASSANGGGIVASNEVVVSGCVATQNGSSSTPGGAGIWITSGIVTGCRASGAKHAIVVDNSSHITDNFASGGTDSTIRVLSTIGGCRIENNYVTALAGQVCIRVSGTTSLVVRNAVQTTSPTPIVATAGNSVGPLVNAAALAASSNPHANYQV